MARPGKDERIAWWVCDKCGWRVWQPAGVMAMSHPCPKDLNRRRGLRRERGK